MSTPKKKSQVLKDKKSRPSVNSKLPSVPDTPVFADVYVKLIKNLRDRIQKARLKAVNAVNENLKILYWDIGCSISNIMDLEGWGAKTVDRISKDLEASQPEMGGFSPRNLRYMVKFFETYRDKRILQQLVAKLPWGHNVVLLDRLKNNKERVWYAQQTIKNGWSRNTLLIFIENTLHKREGKAITNFKATLPDQQSDLAQQMAKDPYCFKFLSLENNFRERARARTN